MDGDVRLRLGSGIRVGAVVRRVVGGLFRALSGAADFLAFETVGTSGRRRVACLFSRDGIVYSRRFRFFGSAFRIDDSENGAFHRLCRRDRRVVLGEGRSVVRPHRGASPDGTPRIAAAGRYAAVLFRRSRIRKPESFGALRFPARSVSPAHQSLLPADRFFGINSVRSGNVSRDGRYFPGFAGRFRRSVFFDFCCLFKAFRSRIRSIRLRMLRIRSANVSKLCRYEMPIPLS